MEGEADQAKKWQNQQFHRTTISGAQKYHETEAQKEKPQKQKQKGQEIKTRKKE